MILRSSPPTPLQIQPRVSPPVLQQTVRCGLPLLSAPISSRSHRSSIASLTAPSLCVTLQVPQAFPEDLLASAREVGDHLHSLSSPPIQPHPRSNPQLCLRLSSSSTHSQGTKQILGIPCFPPGDSFRLPCRLPAPRLYS